MMHGFPELVIGGVLVAPFVLVRGCRLCDLRGAAFSCCTSSPSIAPSAIPPVAELSLYVLVLAFAQRLKEFTALRTLTVESLRRLPWLKLQPQSGTAYVWPDVSALGLPGPDVAAALLCDAGVLVSPGYQFGPASGGHFRLCYARDEAEWAQALDRIVGVLGGLARHHGLPERAA